MRFVSFSNDSPGSSQCTRSVSSNSNASCRKRSSFAEACVGRACCCLAYEHCCGAQDTVRRRGTTGQDNECTSMVHKASGYMIKNRIPSGADHDPSGTTRDQRVQSHDPTNEDDRRKRELEARTERKGHGKSTPPGEERRQEGQHERNRQEKGQVRLNSLTLFLTFRYRVRELSTAWRASQLLGRVRGSATSSVNCGIILTLMSLFLKSVVFMSRPMVFLDGWFS